MKKNGFTLVELLAVVTILSLLLLLIAPKIVNQLNNSKNEVNDVTKKIIYSATEKYIKDNNMKIEYDYCLSIEKLQDGEYLSDTITDNKSGLDIGKKSVLITPKENLGYEYELVSECTNAIEKDYRGYYADVDGDGTPDGVIYADLNKSESGQYNNSNGAYTYTAKTNLNEYTISKNKHNGNFGEKEIIKLKKDKDNPRFYVMALEDFRTGSFEAGNGACWGSDCDVGTYFWYKNAYGKMSTYADDTKTDFGKGYANTGKIIEIWNKNGEGTGSYIGATQDDHDIFKYIQTKYEEGWYIPSRGEWAAFGYYFTNKTALETKLTTSNYNSLYGLSGWYWSSSQHYTSNAWYVNFYYGSMYSITIYDNKSVRLGATF